MNSEEAIPPTKIRKTARGKYKPYNDTRYVLKGQIMIKKITTVIKHNKKEIQKRAIVLGGTALGAFIAGVIVARAEEPLEGVVVVEEDVMVEETETEDPTSEV